jgi:hypothetical protein
MPRRLVIENVPSTPTSPTLVGSPISDSGASIPELPPPPNAMPLSPTSTGNILAAQPDLDATILQGIAEGLVATLRTRQEQYEGAIAQQQEEIELLTDRITANTRQFFTAPEGFIANNGRLPHFTVPTDDHTYQVVRWIQRLPNGRAAGHLADHSPSDDPFVTELYTQPTVRADSPVQPIPPWFRRLLHTTGHQFDELQEAALQLDDWGVYTDIV